jgi:hypothetical protein
MRVGRHGILRTPRPIMAHVIAYASPKVIRLTVSNPVGRGQHNAPDDVLLVQFFLHAFATGIGSTRVLGKPLSLDGIYGMHSDYVLMVYQATYFHHRRVDEVVTREVQPETGTDGTMEEMNDWYFADPATVSAGKKGLMAALPSRLHKIFDTLVSSTRTRKFLNGVPY